MRNGAAISVISVRVSMRVCHSGCVCKREALSIHVCVCVGSFQLAVAERLGASVCQRVTEMMIKNGSHSCSCCRCYVHWHVPKGDSVRGRWRAEERRECGESKCMWVWLSSRARGEATARVQLKFHCTLLVLLLQRLLSTSGPQRQAAGSCRQWAWHLQSFNLNALCG